MPLYIFGSKAAEPAGYHLLTTEEFKAPEFHTFFNSRAGLQDAGESMIGCCVIQIADGFLALPPATLPSFYAAYTAEGVHTCTRDWPTGKRVWFGTAVGAGSFPGAFFGKLNATIVTETMVIPTETGIPGCEAGETSWAIFSKR